ncbi:hypothetical protein FJT64_016043 [Amphibalanus amphitrite]|uniref:Uncharacterized protein n=1 Tax=Amphibalanus amphitrite TaxID=1232801 RepID=A0A6A4XAX3_AMPAM|nr:hypothetical protein FJT64_016043 [Amphibalanus amphitrite]
MSHSLPSLLALVALLAACCASPQGITFGGAAQRTATRQRFRQRPQGDATTDTRIGLVGGQLGNLDPVPGSDYPSRIANGNQQPAQTSQQLRQQPDSGQWCRQRLHARGAHLRARL